MQSALFGALLRTAGGVAGGYLINKGYVTADDAAQLGGAAMTVGVGVWSIVSKFKADRKLKKAIAAPAGLAE